MGEMIYLHFILSFPLFPEIKASMRRKVQKRTIPGGQMGAAILREESEAEPLRLNRIAEEKETESCHKEEEKEWLWHGK